MELEALQRPVRAADVPLERLAGNTQLTEPQKTRELSRQFEAILLRQVLQQGQQTVFPSSWSRPSAANSIYQDLVVNELAEGISQARTLGVARSLEQQLGHQLHTTAPGSAEHPQSPRPETLNHD